MAILHLKTEQQLVEEAQKGKPIFLNFWAPWCGPCQMFANVLNEIDEDLKDKIQIVKVNSDEAPDLAAVFEVQGIPHSRLVVGNSMSEPLVGAIPYEQLKDVLERYLESL